MPLSWLFGNLTVCSCCCCDRVGRQQRTAPRTESETAWLAAAEERLHAREEAVALKLADFDKRWDRLQSRQDEVAQRESDVAQREAAVLAVSMTWPHSRAGAGRFVVAARVVADC